MARGYRGAEDPVRAVHGAVWTAGALRVPIARDWQHGRALEASWKAAMLLDESKVVRECLRGAPEPHRRPPKERPNRGKVVTNCSPNRYKLLQTVTVW